MKKKNLIPNEEVWVYNAPCAPVKATVIKKIERVPMYTVKHKDGTENSYLEECIFRCPSERKEMIAMMTEDVEFIQQCIKKVKEKGYDF